MAGSSLLNDKSYGSIGTKRSAGGGGKQGDKLKLIVAVVLFVLAGGVFAYFQGWIGGSEPKPEPPSAEQLKALDDQKAETKKQIDSGKVIQSGSD